MAAPTTCRLVVTSPRSSTENTTADLLEDDELKVIVPPDNEYAGAGCFPMSAIEEYPFLLLEKGGRAEIAEMFVREGIRPDVRFQTWDDYAIMSMVENGLGISILPSLILRRVPYNISVLPLERPAYRRICIAKRKGKTLSMASSKFLDYVRYREGRN